MKRSILILFGLLLGFTAHAAEPASQSDICAFATEHRLTFDTCHTDEAFFDALKAWSWRNSLRYIADDPNEYFDWGSILADHGGTSGERQASMKALGIGSEASSAETEAGRAYARRALACDHAAILGENLFDSGDTLWVLSVVAGTTGAYVAERTGLSPADILAVRRDVEQTLYAFFVAHGSKVESFESYGCPECDDGLIHESLRIVVALVEQEGLTPAAND